MTTRKRSAIFVAAAGAWLASTLMLVATGPVFAQGKAAKKPPVEKAPATRKAEPASAARASRDRGRDVLLEDGRKVKAYSFGTMDLEGKLKTPQLFYFLNRVRVELDSTNNQKRSFIPELKRTATEKGL